MITDHRFVRHSLLKDLDIVSYGLGANDDIVVEHTNLSPSGANALGWKTSKVDHLAVAKDLNESSTSELTDDAKLTATSVMPPSPGRGALAFRSAKIGVI